MKLGPGTLWILLLSGLVATTIAGCDDEVCQEPDPRGAGTEGDECVTTSDCLEGLTCLGTDFLAPSALCAPPSELPGEVDPGCLDHADDWVEHESHGVQPAGVDDEGCDRLLFVSGCNCVDSPTADSCLPVMPFYRRETWRRCNGCCWQLVSFWQDDAACEPPE